MSEWAGLEGWRFVVASPDEADCLTARGLTSALVTRGQVDGARRADGVIDLDRLRVALGMVRVIRSVLPLCEEARAAFPELAHGGERWMSRGAGVLVAALGWSGVAVVE